MHELEDLTSALGRIKKFVYRPVSEVSSFSDLASACSAIYGIANLDTFSKCLIKLKNGEI